MCDKLHKSSEIFYRNFIDAQSNVFFHKIVRRRRHVLVARHNNNNNNNDDDVEDVDGDGEISIYLRQELKIVIH